MAQILNVIAIDGPAGAGKTTVAHEVAKRLDFFYLETGAMYRAVALIAERRGLSPTQGEQAAQIASRYNITLKPEPEKGTRVFINGEEVTDEIRTLKMAEWASALSAFTPVRKLLVDRQREIAKRGKVVLEGRDTTTVVCPEARLKIFLTASPETRARRIYLQLQKDTNSPVTYEQVLEETRRRDERDSTREDSPLKVAPDAQMIDTDNLTVEQVVQLILEAWRSATRPSPSGNAPGK
ncbi:MAG: (d)CMP kinase [Candidatus Methanosuratincola sp.]